MHEHRERLTETEEVADMASPNRLAVSPPHRISATSSHIPGLASPVSQLLPLPGIFSISLFSGLSQQVAINDEPSHL